MITEEPVATSEPVVTEEPVATDEPVSVPEVVSFETRANIPAPTGDETTEYYLYIEIKGDAVPASGWEKVDGADGRHGGTVYVFSNGGQAVIVDPAAENGVIGISEGELFVPVTYEAAEEAAVYGYLVPAYDGESLASLFNKQQ